MYRRTFLKMMLYGAAATAVPWKALIPVETAIAQGVGLKTDGMVAYSLPKGSILYDISVAPKAEPFLFSLARPGASGPLIEIPLGPKVFYRWVAAPGSEIKNFDSFTIDRKVECEFDMIFKNQDHHYHVSYGNKGLTQIQALEYDAPYGVCGVAI